MTDRAEIIRMAKECGLMMRDEPMHGVERFAALVAAAEREACAKVAESMRPNGGRMFDEAQGACFSALTDCAAAIRARSKA